MSQRRARICEAKVVYETFEEAAGVAARWVAKGEPIEPYACTFNSERWGPHWHVGHVLADDATVIIQARWDALSTTNPRSGWERHYLHDVRTLLDRLRGTPHVAEQRRLRKAAGNP